MRLVKLWTYDTAVWIHIELDIIDTFRFRYLEEMPRAGSQVNFRQNFVPLRERMPYTTGQVSNDYNHTQ